MQDELKPKTMEELQADYTALAAQVGDKTFQIGVMKEEIKMIEKNMMDLQMKAKAVHAEMAAQVTPIVTEAPSSEVLEGA